MSPLDPFKVRAAVKALLEEGCVDPKEYKVEEALAAFKAFDSCYEQDGKLCCSTQADVALWAVLSGLVSEEDVAPYLTWQAFEEYVKEALEEAGFETEKHVRLWAEGRMVEFDVLGYDGRKVIVVECKRWNKSGRRALWEVAKRHRRKVEEASRYLAKYGSVALPVVVTLRSYVPKDAPALVVPIKYLRELFENLDVWFVEYGVNLSK